MNSSDQSLAAFRDRFYCAPECLYFDGNSLGLLSKDAEASVLRVLEEWKTLAIDGWTAGTPPWFHAAEELARLQAPLVGAQPDEVIVHGSTTVNEHLLLASFYRPEDDERGRRRKLLIDELNFPSDRYAAESFLRLKGADPQDALVVVPSRDGRTIAEEDIIAALSDEIAVVLLPAVLYRSGQLLDIRRITRAAHEAGAYAGFDLSHSAGVVPHRLHDDEVDFAFWCTYKYLNSGPGGVASLFVHRNRQYLAPGLAGWFGSDKERQFDMAPQFTPAAGAGAWQVGTPHLLSMAALEGALRIHREAGIERIRARSLELTAYLIEAVDTRLARYGFAVGTPREPERRGGHVALEHAEAIRINAALKERGVVPDFRYPNVIRLAPVPLYIDFADIDRLIEIIVTVMESGSYRAHSSERGTVA